MNIARFALLGVGSAGVYMVIALGLVLVYRASGVLNFAAGAMAVAPAYVFYRLRDEHGLPLLLALLIGVLLGAATGPLVQVLVMRPLRNSSALSKLIATLGVLSVLQGVALVIWGNTTEIVQSILPIDTLEITSDLTITKERLLVVVGGLVIALVARMVYSSTQFGLATTAVSENRRAAASSGWSTARIELINWAIGGALSAVAGIFAASIIGLSVNSISLLVLPAVAAALIGGFNSFLLTVVGALVIGIAQSEAAFYIKTTGVGEALPFVVIAIVVTLGGRARPTRADLPSRLPLPGNGRVNWPVLGVGVTLALVLIWTLDGAWVNGLLTGLIIGIVTASLVLVTGYAGQLSLAQWALAGVAAGFAGNLVAKADWPYWAAALVAVAATIPVGLVVALPALRTRGVNLAIVTLALAQLIVSVVLSSKWFSGGFDGTVVGSARLFGVDLHPTGDPSLYATLALAVFVVAALVIANVRRGVTGRRLLAVRSDETAAASVGIGVYTAKLYAFGLAAAIAALAGVLTGFRNNLIVFTDFDLFTNITVVMFAVIGGIGWVSGSTFATMLATGSLGAVAITKIFGSDSTINKYLVPFAGAIVIVNLISSPAGLAFLNSELYHKVIGRFRRPDRRPDRPRVARQSTSDEGTARSIASRQPLGLEVKDLTVRYGITVALDEVSFRVEPGEVVGLIGPNGAGKTTLLDAVTGFARSTGAIRLDGRSISGWSPVRISRAGVCRSFQGVRLFDGLTVAENLQAADDARAWRPYVTDPILPRSAGDPEVIDRILSEFGLAEVADAQAASLPHGIGRMVGVARALATRPGLLLLDEPAAGLDARESAELGPLVRRIAAEMGASVLVIEHDVAFVLSTCDRVVVLDFGRIIAIGTPAEIREDPAVIAAYLGAESDPTTYFTEAQPVENQ